MKRSKTEYRGGAVTVLRTTALELAVTRDIGPRVITLRSLRGRAGNLFLEIPLQQESYGEYRLCGGHRLWHAPEDRERTYQPDNAPLAVRDLPNGLAVTQPVEPKTGLQKAIKIELRGARTVRVTHALTNRGLWTVKCAPWALTMLKGGGYGVLPLFEKGTHSGNLLPGYALVPWSYTDLSRPVWELHRDFIGINVSKAETAQKLGITAYPGWSAYWVAGTTFVKYARPLAQATYPDLGSCFEVFTNGAMIELETLGPLAEIAPGKSVSHTEHWTVLDGLAKPSTPAVFAKLAVAVKSWLKILR
ncbi:MAG: hypothetical protein KA257_12525 [Opitutaceae bacterium]|nr:hypothetical protein [Opitutaceae bacterium]MBP9901722.1 hypothetical protein [Verrucomicrobiota bacterium]